MGPNDPMRPVSPSPPPPGGPSPAPMAGPIPPPGERPPHEEIMKVLREIKEMLVRIETRLGK